MTALHRSLPLLTAAILAASPAFATTYTWTGSSGNSSDPTNWSNNTPPTSLNTDQLLFPATTPGYSNITFDSAHDPWSLNSLQYTGTNLLYLNASNTHGIQLAGQNPSISSNGSLLINAPLILAANTTLSSGVQLNSPISGAGALTIPSTLAPIYNSTASSTFSGGTTISSYVGGNPTSSLPAALNWNYTTNSSNGPATASFGTGNITLDYGIFHVDALNFAGQSNAPVAIANNFTVSIHGGRLTALQQGPAPANVQFTGNISLAGTLVIGDSNNTPWDHYSSAAGQPILYSGNITLNAPPQFANSPTPLAFAADATGINPITISANISDGTNTSPLTFMSGNITFSGNNTYSHGTVISNLGNYLSSPVQGLTGFNSGLIPNAFVTVAAGSSLGTGNVTIDSNATLRLSAPTNVAAGKISGAGTLSLAFDASPAPLLASSFTGTINYDIPTISTPINFAALPAATRIGADVPATYTGPAIIPSSDHVFRLGSYNTPGLTLPNSVLSDVNGIPASANFENVTLGAPNSYSGGTTVYVGTTTVTADNALGSGNITIVPNGSLVLQTPHAYSSAATVSVAGHLIFQGNSQLPAGAPAPTFQWPGSIEFGAANQTGITNFYPDSLPINLNASTIALHGAISETVGNVSFSGSSEIRFDNNESLTVASLARNPGSLLTINRLSSNNATLSTTSPLPLTHNILSPSIAFQSSPSFDFATYNGNSIVPVSYSAMPTSGGDGNAIALVSSTTYLLGNTSIAALKLQASLGATSAAHTLTITTGGIISDGSYAIDQKVTFGDEAILRCAGTLTLPLAVTAPFGLTANSDNGAATLILSANNNQISGPITILGGSLELASLGNPADTNPITFSRGRFGGSSGYFQIDNSLSTARPINFAAGGSLYAEPAATFTSSAPVSAIGSLSFTGNVIINNTVTATPDPTTLEPGSVDPAGHLTANNIVADQLAPFYNTTVTLNGPTASKVSYLNLTPTSTLSLNNTALIVQTSPPNDKSTLLYIYRTAVSTASSNGTWSGYGITSSNAAANPTHVGIAVADNALLHFSSFLGQSVDNNSILITPALLGDTNLDGKVDLADLTTVLNNFGQTTPYWTSGNFDNASTINLTDLADVLNNLGAAPLFPSGVQSPSLPTPAPEPTSLALLALASPLLLKRRCP